MLTNLHLKLTLDNRTGKTHANNLKLYFTLLKMMFNSKSKRTWLIKRKPMEGKEKRSVLVLLVTTVSCFLNKEPHKLCSQCRYPLDASPQRSALTTWTWASRDTEQFCSLCHKWVIKRNIRLWEGARWHYQKSAALFVSGRKKKKTFLSSSCPDPMRTTASLEIGTWAATATWYDVES